MTRFDSSQLSDDTAAETCYVHVSVRSMVLSEGSDLDLPLKVRVIVRAIMHETAGF